MNLSDILIIASIITGLTSVPYVASSLTSDYGPTGDIILDMDNSSYVPGELSRSLTSNKFEQTYQTPFGKFYVMMKAENFYQELSRPDRKTIIEQTPGKTEWILSTQDYVLKINKTGQKIIDEFKSPDGYLQKIKEMGDVTETIRGSSNVENEYEEAKSLLNSDIEKMKKIMEEHMNIPGTEKVVHIYINEFVSDPEENETEWIELYNGEDEEISLDGWTLEDSNNHPNEIEGIIYPNDYLVITEDDLNFNLNNNGDDIILKNGDGKIIDSITYGTAEIPSPGKGNSTGRISDGSDNWKEFEEPTPWSANA
ncbi:MAG: lamin tail domain-containing protein [Candidatus Aenigmarchaeota archaeon]|nr:lamin tail domain-containing protein [Candidatus Aenigmarchaeota archaeon]